jgi:glucoamylase
MAKLRGDRVAFGWPGLEPRWTQADKDGIGTAYAADSRVWYTIGQGILTEIYYPTIDSPQIRDLQYLITDGETFFHEERRDLDPKVERLSRQGLGYRVTSSDPSGLYVVRKEIIANPHLPCVMQHTEITGNEATLARLRIYALCAPRLCTEGWGNNGYVMEAAGRHVLAAEKHGRWLAVAANVPFSRLSCGYVGQSDGWTDLADNLKMDWEFDRAPDGHVALVGEIALQGRSNFTLAIAFGETFQSAVTALFQSLASPFDGHKQRFMRQWHRACEHILPLDKFSADDGNLYRSSINLLLAHEDKTYHGAFIASLSIPWGEVRGDDDIGGYHLVWTRDMVNSAAGLLASGDFATPQRALVYLSVSQLEDGGFPQNFWINGKPRWHGIQLDEVAFPILLAFRLQRENALLDFDPYPMVRGAATYLVNHGPATQQERWEECAGYSPSTLASNIAALICAACFCRERGEEATATFLEEYADFLESHLEAWTTTTEGSLVPEIRKHFIRILPVDIDDIDPDEDPNRAIINIMNRPPHSQWQFPAREIVDAGFLELVRYGVRKGGDPLVEDSLRVIDAVLKVDTSFGPSWRRYNHDGYGQRDDGAAYLGWGKGRAWPLLTGERGHYELSAGRDVRLFSTAMENFATPNGLLAEQVWDKPDNPVARMYLGRPTGAAKPLMWAQAEYIKLLRSIRDQRVFDFIPEVASRYIRRTGCRLLEVWKPNRRVRTVKRGWALRIQAPAEFMLHWSFDEWQTTEDTNASPTALGISFVNLQVPQGQRAPVRFTFFWKRESRWDGRDHEVRVI